MRLDSLMEVMADPERRSVVYVLDELGAEEVNTDDITRELRDREYLNFEEEGKFEIALHHTYLPKLEEEGVLTHEPETGRITYSPDGSFQEQVEELRELEQEYGGESFIS